MDRPLLTTDLLIVVTAHQQYQDGMRKRAEKASGSFNTGEQRRVLSDRQNLICSSAPSKAWFQDQEENAKRQSSAIMMNDDDNFKPIPVVNELPGTSLALCQIFNCQTDPNQFPRYGQR